jgi:type I restriction enzyme S subunit
MASEVLIGDILKRIKRPISLVDDQEYKLVTIRMNHKGVVLRENKQGALIKSGMYEVRSGDFILSGIDARNGAFGIVPPELDGAIVTNDFWYFEINESIISKELFLELTATTWFDEICKRGSDGTTQRIRLQSDKFFSQSILLPALEEQGELLSKIHLVKEKHGELAKEIESQKSLLSQLKQSILQEAIQGELTKEWRELRQAQQAPLEPASELLKRIQAEKARLIKEKKIKKEKPLPPITESEKPFELPEGWEWCRLGEICSKTGSGSTPSGGKAVYKKEGVKFIRSQNVYDNGLRLKDVAFISEQVHEKMNGTTVQPEDLLLNITGGSIGRCCIVPKDFDEGNINQHVAIIRPFFEFIGYFIHKVICSPYFQEQIIKAQTGAGREGLPKNKMDNILIALPGEEEQQAIVEKVESLMEKCRALEEEISQSEQHAQMLMQAVLKEAFDG